MFSTLQKWVLAVMLFASTAVNAALEIVITEGVNSARPIGIVPFKYIGNGEVPSNINDVIAADLRRSGRFNPISAVNMPQLPSADTEVDYSAWVSEGCGSDFSRYYYRANG